MKQKDIFLNGEADAWFERNQSRLGQGPEPVIATIKAYNIKPKRVLEVGCANGWRLSRLRQIYNCEIDGIDPLGGFDERGTADQLPFKNNNYDVVIYGWCLYLCDPDDYFYIVKEGNRVLKPGGFLIVYDFYATKPHKVEYKHKKGVFSYHYDFSKLWLSHPYYSVYARTVQDNETCVTILKKNVKLAFPEEK